MGTTVCLAVMEVPWTSASVWHRAAKLSALGSGRMNFAVADGQTVPIHPQNKSLLEMEMHGPEVSLFFCCRCAPSEPTTRESFFEGGISIFIYGF